MMRWWGLGTVAGALVCVGGCTEDPRARCGRGS